MMTIFYISNFKSVWTSKYVLRPFTRALPSLTEITFPEQYWILPSHYCFSVDPHQRTHLHTILLQVKGKTLHQQNGYDSLYCNSHFSVLVWNQTYDHSEVCASTCMQCSVSCRQDSGACAWPFRSY